MRAFAHERHDHQATVGWRGAGREQGDFAGQAAQQLPMHRDKLARARFQGRWARDYQTTDPQSDRLSLEVDCESGRFDRDDF